MPTYHYVQNQGKIMIQSKPQFGKLAGLLGKRGQPFFFFGGGGGLQISL